MSTIELIDVSITYRTRFVKTRVLRGANLAIGEREFVAIAGPSGSGKSTALMAMALLLPLTSGSIRVMDKDVTGASSRERRKLRKECISVVFQSNNLIDSLNVGDNVELPLKYRGVSRDARRHSSIEALKLLGLESRANHKINQLSGGQQQRVALARAMVCRPKILLLDEPTGSLDTEATNEVLSILEEFVDLGTTVVVVTHDQNVAGRAGRQVSMVDGVFIE